MDDFALGAAALGATRAVLLALRATGRTYALVDSIGENDTVIFATHSEARHAEHEARKKGKTLHWIVVEEFDLNAIRRALSLRGRHPGRRNGRLHIDHGWLERYYMREIELSADAVRKLQDEVSAVPTKEYPHAHLMRSKFLT